MPQPIPDIVLRWHATWSSLDADRIAALFCENATHSSPYVNKYMGLGPDALNSRAAIQLYAEIVCSRLTRFEAELISVIADYDETGGQAAVEYWRTLDGATKEHRRSLEMLVWQGDEITSCRVFHF